MNHDTAILATLREILWFLVVLAPVSGIVQFGSHAMADRFAYLPSIGCFVAVVWLAADRLRALRVPAILGGLAAAGALAALGAATTFQTGLWRDSRTLYEHALAVTEGNWMAHLTLGMLDAREGRLAAAEANYREALRFSPFLFTLNVQLGAVLVRQGKLEAGIQAYTRALWLRQDHAETWVNLGVAYADAGRDAEAPVGCSPLLSQRRLSLPPLAGSTPAEGFPASPNHPAPLPPGMGKRVAKDGGVYAYLAQGRWFRLTSKVGMFCLGDQRYNARTRFASQTLEITFAPQTCELICLPEKPSQTFRLPVKGLTQAALMGELDPLVTLPAYQLALPFTPQTWREVLLCQSLADTT